MNIQTRKLNAIEYLIHLQDEEVLNKIEEEIQKNIAINRRRVEPFSENELLQRAMKSNEDYLSGNFKSQEQLEIESTKW
ncbi:MAG TPA: hypothetical protein PKD51_03795 [Saprospiraceae bacterium]|nr:hypothetical protein [Saprospiraceae bacterium]HMU02928.1 hypothetical protein [Saprospiraceae bacterium]